MTGQVGRYELLTRLSGGGMGEVFLARVVGVEGFAKHVAVKRIYPDRSGDYQVRKLFVREAKLVAQLDHPNIVQVLELGADGDDLYMAMEFVQGVDLSYLVKTLRKSGQRLTNEQVLVIAQDVMAALEHAHAFIDDAQTISGIIHADVSPHNVMITAQGFAKLCDFGVAKILRKKREETTMRGHWGKLAYMSPEQVREQPFDHRVDIYALGAVLYELFAGKRMLDCPTPEATMVALVAGNIPHLETLRPDLSPLMCEVIHRACTVDPQKRWLSVADLRSALADAAPPFDVAEARKQLADLVRHNRRPTPLPVTVPSGATESVLSESQASDTPTKVISLRPPTVETPSRRRLVVGGGIATLVASIIAITAIHGRAKPPEPAEQPAAPVAESVAPPRVQVQIDTVTDMTAPQPDMRRPTRTKPAAATRPKPTPVRESVQTASAEPARVTINAIPWAHVSIDGVQVKDTPILNHELPAGRHKVQLVRPSGQKVELALNLRPGETYKKIVEFRPE